MEINPFEQHAALMEELGFRKSAMSQLKAYFDLLWASNEELNLFSRKMMPQELVENHFIDCLLPLKYFPKDVKKVADFGTGGGLPAIMYAINFPEVQFHLFEKSIKKQNFLKKCQKLAPQIQIFGEIPPDFGDVDLVTARAFKAVEEILRHSKNYFMNGGRYFLLKGRMEKINEEIFEAEKKFKSLKYEIQPLRSPVLDVERHLLLLNFSE